VVASNLCPAELACDDAVKISIDAPEGEVRWRVGNVSTWDGEVIDHVENVKRKGFQGWRRDGCGCFWL
jgi:hypothetical protein